MQPLPIDPHGRTFRLHRAAVQATTQPWLVAEGRSPARITVAVVVTIANLQRKREEVPTASGTPRSLPPPFKPLTPWPWQVIRQRSSSQKVVFWQRLSWHTYGQRCSLGMRENDALVCRIQVAGRGQVGRAHHSRPTLGAWLYQAQVIQVQLGTR